MPFIEPCLPTLRKEPPTDLGWTHEVKFDGFRVQVHREGQHVAIYGRNGKDMTRRYQTVLSTEPTRQMVSSRRRRCRPTCRRAVDP